MNNISKMNILYCYNIANMLFGPIFNISYFLRGACCGPWVVKNQGFGRLFNLFFLCLFEIINIYNILKINNISYF